MAAYYDTYDYPGYWLGRDYEHKSELVALRAFLNKIPKVNTIVELGAGFGRLTPAYAFRAKKITLVDPSAKLLAIARKTFKRETNIEFLQSSIENARENLKRRSFDLVIMVRVLHHLNDIKKALATVNQLTRRNGYFILEFPNKVHWKAIIINLFKGDITYPIDIFPANRSTADGAIPFLNFHPDVIKRLLEENGFTIVEERSVSNIRSQRLKKSLPLDFLLFIEKMTQKLFARICFGPSIFILAKRVD